MKINEQFTCSMTTRDMYYTASRNDTITKGYVIT